MKPKTEFPMGKKKPKGVPLRLTHKNIKVEQKAGWGFKKMLFDSG